MKLYVLAALAALISLSACTPEPPPGKFKKWGREKGYAMSAPAEKKAKAEEAKAEPKKAAAKPAAKAEAEPVAKAEMKAEPAEEAKTEAETETAEADAATDAKTEVAEAAEAEADAETPAAEPKGEAVAAAGSYDEAKFAKGEKVFKVNCVACHQLNGQGLAGAFPPLVGSEWVTGDPRRPAAIVIRGLMGEIEVKGKKWNNVMAPLGAVLKDDDIAAVLTYVRNAWGNSASEVDVATVAEVRKALKGKTGMWNGGEAVTAFVEGL